MSRIRIKNFGPIKEGCVENDGWIEISKVTVFTGNQGSGKSTVAKLISTFTWIEKALVRGDYDLNWFESENRLRNDFLTYHRLENYKIKSHHPSESTVLEYEGNAFHIRFANGKMLITENKGKSYSLPQIMYVPAERNFISYVKSAKELKLSSDSLKEFLTEFDNAKYTLLYGISISLPINGVDLTYDMVKDVLRIKGENHKLDLSDSSSGFQSIVPVFLVSHYLANSVKKQGNNADKMSSEEEGRFRKELEDIISNKDLTSEQRRIAISVLSSKFNKTAFINIVEEPEQNLYPSSQWELLKSLLEFNNMNSGNKLVMTTHSPYIVNYLSIAIQAGLTRQKLRDEVLIDKLNNIAPENSHISPNDVAIYEMDEKTGAIRKLPVYHGIPSDNNILNQSLAQGNELFDQLLELEQESESR